MVPAEQRLKSALKYSLLILFGVGLALALLEMGLRFYFMNFGTEAQRIRYVYSIDEVVKRAWRFTGQPYTNYGLAPNYPTHNSMGYRGPEITVPKPEGVFRIVALGGSTTYGNGLEDWQDAYPAQLEKILRDDYGLSQVEVINAGVGGYSSWDSFVNFAFRVLDLQPDMVIYYEATNDVTLRLVDPQYYNGLNPVRGIWRSNYEALPASTLYRFIAMRLGWMEDNLGALETWQLRPLAPAKLCDSSQYCNNLGMSPEDVLAANPPIYFERNLRNLIAVAQANDVGFVLSTWAYFPDPVASGGNYMTLQYRQDAVAEHNAILRRLAEENNLPLYDLQANIPYNPDFWIDGVHLTAEGTHEQARQYAAFLIDQKLVEGS